MQKNEKLSKEERLKNIDTTKCLEILTNTIGMDNVNKCFIEHLQMLIEKANKYDKLKEMIDDIDGAFPNISIPPTKEDFDELMEFHILIGGILNNYYDML